ncbi:hypothetical protein H2199_008885 [Coniosporium tulheliwenetii]|uniref:Uncharacterized protein n=1 Tax=Coniosporium tulheliwenetii TaxID=3383036 RepID=A0ACC2YHC4_9PEZI|nr:hypothetical protein H2199_008885 [Cladosporium sp. JES 115]
MPGKRDKIRRLFAPGASGSSSSPGGAPIAQQAVPIPSRPANVPSLSSMSQSASQSNASMPTTQTARPPPSSHRVNSSSNVAGPGLAPPDLWTEALHTLSVKEQAAIRNLIPPQANSPQPLSDVIGDLCALVEKKRAECEDKRWKFEHNGQQVILRDVADRVIICLDKFKAVGDVAVNYDPSHLSLPWAGVRFILHAAVAESQQMGDLLVATEKATYLINRGTIYELLYLQCNHGTSSDQVLLNLRGALVKLYATVLRLHANANRLYDKSTASRAIHAVLNPDEVRNFVQECQTLEERVDIEASNCERMYAHEAHATLRNRMENLQQLLDEMKQPVVRVDDRVAELWDRSNLSQQYEILRWTSDTPYEENHKTARDGRTEDTGKWLLMHERYLQWRKSTGAGKTKLASTVVDGMLLALSGQPNNEALAYFYCDRNQTSRQEPVSVLRSFVRQLSTTRTGDAMLPPLVCVYQQKKRTGFASGPLDMKECEDLLLRYVDTYPQTTLVLDALDECDQKLASILLPHLTSSKPIKIFISSRPDSDIKDRFEIGPNVGIQATDNQDDIAKFVAAAIEDRRKKLSSKLKQDIVDTLLAKSLGMFQWAALQIAQILELDREKDIRLRLGKLPVSLREAYDEIWESIRKKPGSAFDVAERAFQWVMCSRKPLPPELLVAAVCQDPETAGADSVDTDIDINFVLAACCNLLVIDPELQVCRFSHLSVQEYLETHRLMPIQAEDFVARVCLRLLCDATLNSYDLDLALDEQADEFGRNSSDEEYDQYESDEEHGQEETYEELNYDESAGNGLKKLLRYARAYWTRHVQKCEEAEDTEQLSTLLIDFLGSMNESGPAYRIWHAGLLTLDASDDDLIHYAEERLSPPSSSWFPICYFGFYRRFGGFLPICRRLIELGANVNARNEGLNTALHGASLSGHKKIVELLLDHGADVNAQDEWLYTALHYASLSGHKKIVKLLLDHGANVNAQDEGLDTALHNASSNGYEKIVKLLLDHGANVNAQDEWLNTALHYASSSGHEKIVELLLKRGADVHARSWGSLTALQIASRKGHKEIERLLLEWGATT